MYTEDGAGELPIAAFISGALRLKGNPCSVDMKAMLVSVMAIGRRLVHLEREMGDLASAAAAFPRRKPI